MDSGQGWGLIIFITIVWALWHFDVNPTSNKISVYQQEKECKKNSTYCKWRNLRVVTYYVNPNNQIVVSFPSDSKWPPNKFNNCAVIDRKNWSCSISNISDFHFGFSEGDYMIEDSDKIRTVSKSKFWLTKISEFSI